MIQKIAKFIRLKLRWETLNASIVKACIQGNVKDLLQTDLQKELKT
jgi:hypothetical protein